MLTFHYQTSILLCRRCQMDETMNQLYKNVQETPSETIPVEGIIPDFSQFSKLPVLPNKDTWWQDLRNAYGLQQTMLRDMMVKQNNFIAQTKANFEALLTIVQ